VLLKPRFGWDTALLWLAPGVVLLLGVIGLVSLLRRRSRSERSTDEPPLSKAEQARVTELLGKNGPSTTRPS
jgi:cytochrome c-type biogenesis protein CcmH